MEFQVSRSNGSLVVGILRKVCIHRIWDYRLDWEIWNIPIEKRIWIRHYRNLQFFLLFRHFSLIFRIWGMKKLLRFFFDTIQIRTMQTSRKIFIVRLSFYLETWKLVCLLKKDQMIGIWHYQKSQHLFYPLDINIKLQISLSVRQQ